MLSLEGNAHLQQLTLHLPKHFLHPHRHLPIVVVRKLLVLSSYTAEETPTSHPKVMPIEVGLLRDHEELLF